MLDHVRGKDEIVRIRRNTRELRTFGDQLLPGLTLRMELVGIAGPDLALPLRLSSERHVVDPLGPFIDGEQISGSENRTRTANLDPNS